jgi:RIB43A
MRIISRREANEERRKRFLDARTRLIGLDVSALDAQVADKEKVKLKEKELLKLERKLEYILYDFELIM